MSATPETQLHEQFSSPDAAAMPWDEAAAVLGDAEIYWVTTVRPDGRPHVTPLVAVWLDDALYFCTGNDERKARNLRENRSCVMTTGCNLFRSGIDVVVEGDATNVTDVASLQTRGGRALDEVRLAVPRERRRARRDRPAGRRREPRYRDRVRVAPSTIFAYARGGSFSATRYRF